MTTYKIIRFWENGRRRTIARGLTKEAAQAHCRDPKTHKLNDKGLPIWFDGFDEE